MNLVRTRYGDFRVIETDSIISQSLQRYGEWAYLEIEMLLRLIKAGDSVADIGAFIGTHSRAFSDAVGAEGQVYAFEPRQMVTEVLQGNAELATHKNIAVFQCGLGSEEKILQVARPQTDETENFGGFSLTGNTAQSVDCETIHLRTLDHLNFPRIDFMKIDVEGMEIDVLNGGKAVIDRDRPLIFAEVNSLQAGLPLLAWCERNAYAMYGAIHPAFNPNNFAGTTENIFSIAVEVGALLIPIEKMPTFADFIRLQRLVTVKHADDLALILLHKPQYGHEVLEKTNASSVLSIDLSPFCPEAQQAISDLKGQVKALEAIRDALLHQLPKRPPLLKRLVRGCLNRVFGGADRS